MPSGCAKQALIQIQQPQGPAPGRNHPSQPEGTAWDCAKSLPPHPQTVHLGIFLILGAQPSLSRSLTPQRVAKASQTPAFGHWGGQRGSCRTNPTSKGDAAPHPRQWGASSTHVSGVSWLLGYHELAPNTVPIPGGAPGTLVVATSTGTGTPGCPQRAFITSLVRL